jgi:hypothetical protein
VRNTDNLVAAREAGADFLLMESSGKDTLASTRKPLRVLDLGQFKLSGYTIVVAAALRSDNSIGRRLIFEGASLGEHAV